MNDTTDAELPPELRQATHLGKCWAALRGDTVVATTRMRVPNDVDFAAFRSQAIAHLETLGEVRAGDLFANGEAQYFMPRPHKHQNRSKKRPKPTIKPLRVSSPTDDRTRTDR